VPFPLQAGLPITISQAALGADISIRTLDDRTVVLKIPSGTTQGKLLRIKGEGVPFTGTTRKGDLYVKIMVELPTKLTREQAAVMQEYARLENATTSPALIPLESLR